MFFRPLVSLLLVFAVSITATAKHFELKTLPHAGKANFDLTQFSGKMSYFDFVRNHVGIYMQKQSHKIQGENEKVLKSGGGISVMLNPENYNVHVNFPNASSGGRSFGWTAGQVGDWSDAMYLDELEQVIYERSEQELADFYKLVIEVLGASQADRLSVLDPHTQLVANNFLAIYTAEAYRAMVPDGHKNWDEALLEVTLLSAFHSGQDKLTKFYAGKFQDFSRKQNSGVYNRGKPGVMADKAPLKKAQLRDYWQFSADPESKRSGINITRRDFEKMGQEITRYQRYVKKNPDVETILTLTGGDQKNVIKAIAQFFGEGKSKDVTLIPHLADVVSRFLMDVRTEANEMTQWQKRQ